MKVLITGASGFLGGHLTEMALGAGHQVRGMVRKTSRTERLQEMPVEIVEADLKDEDALRTALQGVEVVINAASTTAGVPQEYEAATIKGTHRLLALAAEESVRRFVHISSIGVCRMQNPQDGGPITENAPYEDEPVLLTTYTRSKIASEKAALEFAGQDGAMNVIVIRPGLMYGPRGKAILPRMGYSMGSNAFLVIGNGRNVLPACYVRNCARAALLAAEGAGDNGDVFSIVDDELFTQVEYLKRLKSAVRPKMKIFRLPYFIARMLSFCAGLALKTLGRPNPLHPAHLIACHRRVTYSNEKAKDVLGWTPEVGRDEALDATMAYHASREALSRRARFSELARPVKAKPPVKACVVGCGGIAVEHLGILRRLKHADVAALCDVNPEAARELAEQFDVPRTYTDLGDMLEQEKPQVLHVLTPPQFHAHDARLAAEHGCNVLVEKPMAVDAVEAREMIRVARDHGVYICVDHNHLYDPTIVRARRMIESGAVGEIIWVESFYGFNLAGNPGIKYMLPGGEKHWTFGLPGGMYQNLAPHPLCLALELLGRPAEVDADARFFRVLPQGPTDELRILLKGETAGGVVTVSLAAMPRFQYLKVVGTRGTLTVDILNKWVICEAAMRGVPKPIARAISNVRHGMTVMLGTLWGTAKVLMRRWTPYDGMAVLIGEYYSALQEGREAPVPGEEALEVMEVMDRTWSAIGSQAIEKSAAEVNA